MRCCFPLLLLRLQTNVGRQLKEMLQIPDQAKIGFMAHRWAGVVEGGTGGRGEVVGVVQNLMGIGDAAHAVHSAELRNSSGLLRHSPACTCCFLSFCSDAKRDDRRAKERYQV